MRLIDADALFEKYTIRMNELIKCVGDENKSPYESVEAISLLCGTVLIREAPTIEVGEEAPVENIHDHTVRLGTCGYCKNPITYKAVYCSQCGRKAKWTNGSLE